MKIKILRPCIVNGKHTTPNSVIDVSDKDGRYLTSIGKAMKYEEPEPEQPPSELTQIDGISDKVAAGLAEFGIVTLENLAGCSVEDLEEAVKAAGVGQGARKKETWAEQAKALLEQDAE